jgi:hypothetical protein
MRKTEKRSEILKRKHQAADVGVNGRIILKRIIEEYV